MSYLIPAGADARFVDTLCRPLSPLDDLRTLLRLYREFRALKPAIVHTHMAKAGMLGRAGGRRLQPDARLGAAREGRAHLSRPRARRLLQPVR